MATDKQIDEEAREYAKEEGVTTAFAFQHIRRKHGLFADGSKQPEAKRGTRRKTGTEETVDG